MRKSRKEAAHHLVVQAVRAVEDHTLLGQRLGQVLGRLRLASAGRPCRSTAQIKLQSAHKTQIAAIGEWGDDKSWTVTEIFVTISEPRVSLLAEAIESRVVTFEGSTIKLS